VEPPRPSFRKPGESLEDAIRSRWDGRPAVAAADGVLVVAARAARRLAEELAALEASRVVADVVSRRPGIDDALTFVYGFDVAGFDVDIRPIQLPGEIESLLRLVEPMQVRTVLEIGTARGGTLFLLATVAADDALLVSVDLPFGRFGGGYAKPRRRLYRAFARHGQRVELLQGDSHQADTRGAVRRVLGHRPVDLLLIDGDHTYEGVQRDFRDYGPLVREGGLIVLHDIAPGDENDVGGVPRFWQELRVGMGGDEIVSDWSQGGFGLGVVTRRSGGDGSPGAIEM
jgi:predicted O-methyltransferase YrrM